MADIISDGLATLVSEMETLEKWSNIVPIDKEVGRRLAEQAKDDNPEFPIVRVEEGWSENGRLWDGEELVSIARQINELEPVGHLGHIPDDKWGDEFGNPQTLWLGAITRKEPSQQKDRKGEEVMALYAKGYNLPGAAIRGYLSTRIVRGVSWKGRCDKPIAIPGRGVQMRGFVLKAFDWARKHSEGMPTARLVALSSEMEGGSTVDAIEVGKITPEQLEQANPNLVTLLKGQGAAEGQALVSEMEEKVTKADGDTKLVAKLRSMLGLKEEDDLLTKITELKDKSGAMIQSTFESLLDGILGQKVPDENSRKVARRLIMAGVNVAEMDGKDEALVGEMVEDVFNTDEDIKRLVSEQTAGRNVNHSSGERENGNSSLVSGVAKL